MNRKESNSFLNEITEKVMELKQISEESELDYTQELVRTLGRLSEISNSYSSELRYSEDSHDLSDSNLILQPTNSLLGDSSIDSQTSLITSIKNKNTELQKACSQKLSELRTTTKEFTRSRLGVCNESPEEKYCPNSQSKDSYSKDKSCSRKEYIVNDEITTAKADINRTGSSTQEMTRYCIRETTLDNILGELSQLKNDLTDASSKLVESNDQMLKQHDDSLAIKMQLEILIESHSKFISGSSCRCIVF
ncbi:hypothetical protein SteCoe_16806 [Stentor coeruleus]|uniref:Uncharacterized protein n=1 Tax=Stentor coeruleus TaxID=5963 RepID=A0A1R2C0L5_9CILI|nr:hypothetical protein SteCoe_16806 [Stentor coeruleus]